MLFRSELIETIELADELGFYSVCGADETYHKDMWSIFAAAARSTSRIKLTTDVTHVILKDPTILAQQAATLDELSGGRAVLGYGLHTDEMVEWVGFDASDRVERIRESVAAVRSLLRGKTLRDEWYLRFEPVRPDPPIYVTPYGRDLLELSGEIGDGSLPLVMPPAAAPGVVEAIHAGARRADRDPAEVDVAACVWISVAEDGGAAAASLRPIVAYFAPYFLDDQLAPAGLTRGGTELLDLPEDLVDVAGVLAEDPRLEHQRVGFARAVAHLAPADEPLVRVDANQWTGHRRVDHHRNPHIGDLERRGLRRALDV